MSAAADSCVDAFVDNLMGGHCNGLQTGGAESIDGGARNGDRKSSDDRGDSRYVRSLRSVRLGAATESRPQSPPDQRAEAFLQNILNTMGGKIVRPSDIKGSAERFSQASPGAGDDDSFSHEI